MPVLLHSAKRNGRRPNGAKESAWKPKRGKKSGWKRKGVSARDGSGRSKDRSYLLLFPAPRFDRGAGVGIYFGSRHPEPKPTEFQAPSRPSFSESTPVAVTTPLPTPSTFI